MSYQIEYAYTCHMGKLRTNNEDNFWCCGDTLTAENQGLQEIKAGTADCEEQVLMAVFDGMGGESCGEIAAFLAAETCGKCYEENRAVLKENPEQFLDQTCKWMNRAVCEYAMENRIGCMGSTAALLSFGKNYVVACNLGDSRIYQWNKKNLEQVSTDHVLRGTLYRKAPLTQYVGIPEDNMELEPSFAKGECLEEMRYLICSDGLTDMLPDEEIAEILAREFTVKDTVEKLLEKALSKGGRDNITMVLCQIRDMKEETRIKTWLRKIKNVGKKSSLFS